MFLYYKFLYLIRTELEILGKYLTYESILASTKSYEVVQAIWDLRRKSFKKLIWKIYFSIFLKQYNSFGAYLIIVYGYYL